ncbi:MAG: hypothetical protein K2P59_13780 [Acetatifactor sp.]|nr:hypothetical protein [Acetatifactor sp.]
MEENELGSITAFDSLFTTNRIQMMKVLLPYLKPEQQRALAVCIKIMELNYTLSFFKNNPHATSFRLPHKSDTSQLWDEILPFCGPEERGKVENMKNMMQSMKQMQEMMETMQMMQEMFPEGMDMENMDLSSIMEMMGNST